MCGESIKGTGLTVVEVELDALIEPAVQRLWFSVFPERGTVENFFLLALVPPADLCRVQGLAVSAR